MIRRDAFFISMLVCFMFLVPGIAAARAIERTGGFVIKRLIRMPDSLRTNRELFQDTTKKKIKEIAPARPQPKPERVNEPTEQGRPGVISHPQFPGVDNRQPPLNNGGGSRQQPGNDRPQPQSGGGGARPQGGPPGRPGGR